MEGGRGRENVRHDGWTRPNGLVHNAPRRGTTPRTCPGRAAPPARQTSALPAQEGGPRHPALSALTAPVPQVAGGTAHRRPGSSGLRCRTG
ncbi:hypothetical protein F750_4769 [Streptomyces sp. PAMC 26508]|nr:hypothetical protein F750_4769 [Streptomyces sp. PAMC 26508]